MHFFDSITLPDDLSQHSEIIDVRSPSEYALDHIPGAINLPVLNDEERVLVGTLHKTSPFEARKIGARLISANAARHLQEHFADKDMSYAPLLYCWRGGQRSRSLTHILSSVGWKAKLLKGGYRAFRKHVVDELEEILTTSPLQLTVLSGLTGVGKTRLLNALTAEGAQVLDLEGLANHKGSLLGNPHKGEQPSQKQFETRLWEVLSKCDPTKPIFTEAESNRIGRVHCPAPLWKKLSEGKLIQTNLEISERIKLLREDYPHFTEDPESLSELLDVLRRIRGNQQVDTWQQQIAERDWDAFLTSILVDHYDLSYRHPADPKSNYSPPVAEVTVASVAPADYITAAKTVIALEI